MIVSEDETSATRLRDLHGSLKCWAIHKIIGHQFDQAPCTKRPLCNITSHCLWKQSRGHSFWQPGNLIGLTSVTPRECSFPIFSMNNRQQEIFSLSLASYQRPTNLESILVRTKSSAKKFDQCGWDAPVPVDQMLDHVTANCYRLLNHRALFAQCSSVSHTSPIFIRSIWMVAMSFFVFCRLKTAHRANQPVAAVNSQCPVWRC